MKKLLGKIVSKAVTKTGKFVTRAKQGKTGRFYKGGGRKPIRSVKGSTVKRAGKITLGAAGAGTAAAGAAAVRSSRKKAAAKKAASVSSSRTSSRVSSKPVVGTGKAKVNISAGVTNKTAKKKTEVKKTAKKKLTAFQMNRLKGRNVGGRNITRGGINIRGRFKK